MELIETMLVTNGNIKNFNYHLERVKKAYEYFKWKFDEKEWIIKLTSSKFQVPSSKFYLNFFASFQQFLLRGKSSFY